MKSIGKLPMPTSTQCQHNLLLPPCIQRPVPLFSCSYATLRFPRRHKTLAPVCSVLKISVQSKEESKSESIGLPIMVNTRTGQMGRAVLESAIAAGVHPVPISLGSPKDAAKTVEVGGKEIKVLGTSERESVLSSMYEEYPDLIIVDYTVSRVLKWY